MIIFHEFAMRLPKNIPVLYLFYFIWYSPFLSNLCLLGNEIICSISLWLEQIKCLTLFKLLKHCLKMMKAPLSCSHVSLKQLTRKNWMWSVGEKFLEGKAVFKKFGLSSFSAKEAKNRSQHEYTWSNQVEEDSVQVHPSVTINRNTH